MLRAWPTCGWLLQAFTRIQRRRCALHNRPTMFRAGAISLALLLASRLLGLLRESAQAAAFGTSGVADVVVLMLSLPDWVTSLVATGALSYVLLPLWARQTTAARAASERVLTRALLTLGTGLALGLWLSREPLLAALAPGLGAAAREAGVQALRYAAVALPLALLAALWATRAQHAQDFTGLYGANLVVNGVLVTALMLIAILQPSTLGLDVMGVSLLLAMGARLLWLGWRRRARLDRLLARDGSSTPAALPGAAVWLWAALAAGLPLALPFVARSFASGTGEGALATFNYAWKLVELPLVLAVQLAATLSFPRIAAAYAQADAGAPAQRVHALAAVRAALALAWALACMAAAGLLEGAQALALALFGWGRMGPEALATLAQWARIGAWSLLPQALIAVALTALASQTRLRAAAAVWALGLGVLLIGGFVLPRSGSVQMVLLVVVFSAVALGLVSALGIDAHHVLPLRLMAYSGAALAMLAWASAALGLPAGSEAGALAAWAQGDAATRWQAVAVPLMWATLAAVTVGALAWGVSADLRASLRR